MQERQEAGEGEFDSWVGKIPWSGKWHPSPVFLPGKFNWLLGGCKESDVTDHRLLKYQIYAPKGSVF